MLEIVSIFLATKLHVIIVLTALVFVALASDYQRLRILVLATISLPLTFIVSRSASLLVENPRPFLEHDFMPLVAHAADNGFPSDHALLVFAIASIVFTFNKSAGIVLFIMAALVGFGRVLVGVHHVVDVLGSFVIAVSIISLCYLTLRSSLTEIYKD